MTTERPATDNPSTEGLLRKWARDNYNPSQMSDPEWKTLMGQAFSPIIIDEWEHMKNMEEIINRFNGSFNKLHNHVTAIKNNLLNGDLADLITSEEVDDLFITMDLRLAAESLEKAVGIIEESLKYVRQES